MFRAILSIAAISVYSVGGLSCSKNNMELGQQQLTEILNAAWVRVMYNGEYDSIVESDGVSGVAINIADCLPVPDSVPFPEVGKLKCNAKEIIKRTNVLKFGQIPANGSDLSGIDTTGFFRNTGKNIREAIVNQININYNIDIDAQIVPIFPYRDDFTAILNDGTIDVLDQTNALGGIDSNDNLRRNVRLFSCTLIGSGQFIMVPDGSSINNKNDITNLGSNARICAGQLSTQLTNRYFPEAQVSTIIPPPFGTGDIKTCILGLANDDYDAYVTIFPNAADTGFDFAANGLSASEFRVFSTNIVAGTPYWIAKDLDV